MTHSVFLKRWFFYALGAGVFTALFLIIYQPFGTYEFSAHDKYWFLSGYGMIVFIVVMICSLLVRLDLFKTRSPSNKQLLPVVLITTLGLCLAACGSYLYKQWYFNSAVSIVGLFQFMPYLVATGIIPALLIIWFERNHAAVKLPAEKFRVMDHNGRELVQLSPEDLLLVKASDNYVELVYQIGQKTTTSLIRATLSGIAKQLEAHPHLVRCHRSYLVNLSRVHQTSGNKQAYQLHLDRDDIQVPVSRKYVSPILRRLQY